MRISIKRPKIENNKVKLQYTIDNPSLKFVKAVLKNRAPVILWEGSEYDAIGQWMDTDIKNRLEQLFPGLVINV